MEQLSSCYFCGTALDASLDEYPIVPKSLQPGPSDQLSVVLCQGCRRKLGTVVEAVVDAAETDSPATDSGDGDEADEWDELIAGETDADADAATNVDATTTADSTTDATTDSTGPQPADSSGRAATDSPAVSGSESSTGPTDASTSGSGDESGGESAAESADDRPSMTALENTKVMRLLQNREFPVDRAEIRIVAVNAYDISESQFDAVVDAAVDRGLIDEENGQFVEGA